MTLPEIQQATTADPTLQFLMELITTGKWYLIDTLNIQSYPNVKVSHEGHLGLVKTKQLLCEKVWYLGIDKLAKNAVDACILCQANRSHGPPEPLCVTTLPPQPWHTVNIDFCGPFPGGAYLLVVIDAYSRFPEVEIVSSTSVQSTILTLKIILATITEPLPTQPLESVLLSCCTIEQSELNYLNSQQKIRRQFIKS